jgi:membrane protease YdiL (CAAX protease family)
MRPVRITGSVLLAIGATLLGVLGAFMLGVSGLSLAGPGFTIIEYSDSDDSERAIGIGMGVIALLGWLLLLLSAAFAGLGGDHLPRARRAIVWLLLGLSAVLVLGLLTAVLATPPPASEYPLPEWNRAQPRS